MAEREDERSFLMAEKAYERFSETARHALILLFSLCCLDFCGLFMDKTFIDLSKIIPMLAIPGAVIKLLFDAIRMCCHKNIRQIIILKAMLKALVFVVSYRLYTYYSVTEDGRDGIFRFYSFLERPKLYLFISGYWKYIIKICFPKFPPLDVWKPAMCATEWSSSQSR